MSFRSMTILRGISRSPEVDALPAKRVRHGRRTLDLRAEQGSEAKQVAASAALHSKNGLNAL